MPTRDSYHVVAIDFSPHTEAMQTDALLETGAYSASGVPVFESGGKNMAVLVFVVAFIVVLIMILSTL